MLTKKQLEATASLSEYNPEKELAQTALAYRTMLAKALLKEVEK